MQIPVVDSLSMAYDKAAGGYSKGWMKKIPVEPAFTIPPRA
jgi:hypothetical protein